MNTNHILTASAFSLTVFLSALLLFVIQPMASSMVLPHLGGSSTVWTTCMLFFQTMLLAGYLYAHGLTRRYDFRAQVLLHGAVLVLSLFFLPVAVPETILRSSTAPALYLLMALLVGIGLPTFVVSSSAPLFQHWFGLLDHPHAEDPYYLYAASNAGSILALVSYPFLIDRTMTLATQSVGWTAGFFVLALFAGFCLWLVSREGTRELSPGDNSTVSALRWNRKVRWIVYTFIPSSLMLGLTHYITTDLASVPLLWIIPLAIYLLSFILVFARLNHPLRLYRFVLPPALLTIFALTFYDALSYVNLIGLHVVGFFLVALYFHGEVAQDRPETEHLTRFYIYVALGGSLGGVFNAILAPVLFNSILEYYLVIALAILLGGRTCQRDGTGSTILDGLYYLLAGTAGVYYLHGLHYGDLYTLNYSFYLAVAVTAAVSLYLLWKHPVTTNFLLAGLFVLGYWHHGSKDRVIAEQRSFYGHYRVMERENFGRLFLHGTTEHGFQKFENGEPINTPTSYYHPDGPLKDIRLSLDFDRVGIGGLGVGGISAYARKGNQFEFFEIDPVVETIARKYFGYLEHCGKKCTVHTGDARKRIGKRPDHYFSLIIMDAYTSDAIPTHLLTREAVKLYLSKVEKTGAVVFHVSNRHLDLEGVIGAIAEKIDAYAMTKTYVPPVTKTEASSSTYVVLARNKKYLRDLFSFRGWKKTEVGSTLWTDNYTNIVSVLKGEDDRIQPPRIPFGTTPTDSIDPLNPKNTANPGKINFPLNQIRSDRSANGSGNN